VSEKGRASIGNPNPTEAVPRANLGRDGSNLQSKRRGDPRSEYSGPSATRPIGRASGSGTNRVHSHRAPTQCAAPPSWIPTALPQNGAACAETAKARPTADATIKACISVSEGT